MPQAQGHDWHARLAGRFVVFDGPDGAGKTTQLQRLADALKARGVGVHCVRDPGSTPIGDEIRRILLDPIHCEMTGTCETMLYMASRAQLAEEVIRPRLTDGLCVLCDRWISSTIAYQGAAGEDVDDIYTVGRIAVKGLWPDAVVLLTIPPEEGLRRAGRRGALDRMEAKGPAFHRRVLEGFMRDLVRLSPKPVVTVEAGGSVEQIHQRVCRALAELRFEN